MANFVDTANAVVSLLQELETVAETAGEKFLSSGQNVEGLASKSKQHAKDVDEALTALEQRVAKTREGLFNRIGTLKQKLAQMYFTVNDFAESTKQEMGERENTVTSLDKRLETLNSQTKTLTDEVTKEVESATTNLNTSNDTMKTDLDRIEEQLEKGQKTLDEMATNFERELREVTDFVEDRCIRVTQEYTDQVDTELSAHTVSWDSEMTTARNILTDDLATAVARIQAAESEARADVQEIVQEVEQAYDGEKVDAAAEKTQQSTQQMSQRMQHSETSFNESVSSFSELLDVMKKMVQ